MRLQTLIILLLISALSHGIKAQLSNSFFTLSPTVPKNTFGASVEMVLFLKNNEYFNPINPGETFFGFQTKAMAYYKISPNATLQGGLLLQKNFGDDNTFSKAIPIFNFALNKNLWKVNLGNIQPHVFHKMIEPMLSYENIITQPVELGIQAIKTGHNLDFYDVWLNWRQNLNKETGKQEMIVFGQSADYTLFRLRKIRFSNPLQATIYHRGGQALNTTNSHIATRINFAAGIRARYSAKYTLESFYLQSLDNSPQLTQPYSFGWASMTNLNLQLHKHHQIALTWWYARQFQTTLGNSIFSNVNLNDVYLNRNTRRFAMLRYVYSAPLFNSNIWMDFRFEPYYDFEYKKTEFSNGLYFRYVGTLDIQLPNWMHF